MKFSAVAATTLAARLDTVSRMWLCSMALLGIGCGHSDAFVPGTAPLGPIGTGADVLLTRNPEQDYWPAWTQDGKGILYAFVPPGTTPQHRCVGLLPAGGGQRTWQLCDDRATQNDSINGFTAFALNASGEMLYVEAVARSGVQGSAPAETTLWLADSATPFQRRALLTLPTFAGSAPVSWLADLTWTGADTFLALAENLTLFGHCLNCGLTDSLFFGQNVVRGVIGPGGATLQAIAGTGGATGYSLAENGATIAFIRRDDPQLYRVPAAGGTDSAVALVAAAQLLGVSCRGGSCVVADDPVTLSAATNGVPPAVFASIGAGSRSLHAVALATGQVQLLLNTSAIVATPAVSPLTGDVVAQVGGAFGHLQTFSNSGSDLHLFVNLLR